MNETLINEIAAHMEKVAPGEGCGFIIKSNEVGGPSKFIPVVNQIDSEIGLSITNSANDPNVAFLIDPLVYIKHSRDIEYILHSHVYDDVVDNDEPSPADRIHQRATAVPWMIFVIERGKYKKHYMFGD